MIYRAGTIIVIEQGEFSNYAVMDVARVLKDFDLRELQQAWMASAPVPGRVEQYPEDMPETFVRFMVEGGFVEIVPSQHCHVGSYGQLTHATEEFSAYWEGLTSRPL